jgi:hypothetical protein
MFGGGGVPLGMCGKTTYVSSIGSLMKLRKQNRRTRVEARMSPEGTAVAQVEVIRLSREAQQQFVSMLLNPVPPSAAILRALERHRHSIVE